jgi:hypothetical protein
MSLNLSSFLRDYLSFLHENTEDSERLDHSFKDTTHGVRKKGGDGWGFNPGLSELKIYASFASHIK